MMNMEINILMQFQVGGVKPVWHANKRINNVISSQINELEHLIFANFTHISAIDLCGGIRSKVLPLGLEKFLFADNGSSSVLKWHWNLVISIIYKLEIHKNKIYIFWKCLSWRNNRSFRCGRCRYFYKKHTSPNYRSYENKSSL